MQTPSVLLRATVYKNTRILSSFTHFNLLFYDFIIVLQSAKGGVSRLLTRIILKYALMRDVMASQRASKYTLEEAMLWREFHCTVYKLSSSFYVTLPLLPQSLSFSLPVLYTQESFCLEMRWKRQKPPLKNTTLHVCVREREKVRQREREKGRNDIERWTDWKLTDIKTLSSVFCGCANFYFPHQIQCNSHSHSQMYLTSLIRYKVFWKSLCEQIESLNRSTFPRPLLNLLHSYLCMQSECTCLNLQNNQVEMNEDKKQGKSPQRKSKNVASSEVCQKEPWGAYQISWKEQKKKERKDPRNVVFQSKSMKLFDSGRYASSFISLHQ